MSDPFEVIYTGVLPVLTEVRLYDSAISHVRQEHPEVPIYLPCIFTAVQTAIIKPTHVEASYGNSVVFVDADTTDASGNPLRIPIKIVDGTSGRIKTFYFASTSGVRNVVWERA